MAMAPFLPRRSRRTVAEMLAALEAYQRGTYQPRSKREAQWLRARAKALR